MNQYLKRYRASAGPAVESAPAINLDDDAIYRAPETSNPLRWMRHDKCSFILLDSLQNERQKRSDKERHDFAMLRKQRGDMSNLARALAEGRKAKNA